MWSSDDIIEMMLWFGLRRRRPVRFVYAPAFAGAGSTVMRGGQLAGIAARNGLGDRSVEYVPLSATFRRADLFLTKGVLKTVDRSVLASWRRQGNRLFADPVDEGISDDVVDGVDAIVAASRTAYDAYRQRWPSARVEIIDHHVDPRVTAVMSRSHDPLNVPRFGYFGEAINTIRSKRIARTVEFVDVSTSRPGDEWIDRLPGFNAHYAVRRTRELDHYKPFLKGFTAAACRAVILIQADQEEAQRWLPADYPFWLHGKATEPAIIDAIEHMHASFGTDAWARAEAAMRDIEEATSPRAIGQQLVTLFS